MKFLLDASAIIPLIRKLKTSIVEYIDQFLILDLTLYEIGNALWKRYYLKSTKSGETERKIEEVIVDFATILASINVNRIKPDDLKEILRIAGEHKLTFYDASYVYVAEKRKLQLITEDKEILKKYQKAINLEDALGKLKHEDRGD